MWDPEKIVIVFDHCVPAETPAHERNHRSVRAFAEEQQLPHFLGAEAGVCHQVMMERGFVQPGSLVVGADSHSTLYGAMGALGIPINRTEMAGLWATGEIWFQVPETLKIVLEGDLSPGVYAKDVMLMLLAEIGADGASYRAIEYSGTTVDAMSMASRMTLTNMAIELGAKAGITACDGRVLDYCEASSHRSPEIEPIFADSDARYERCLRFDVEELEPLIACPHRVDHIEPLEAHLGLVVNQGYLGSCTNGRIEDLEIAAAILRGRRIAQHTRLVVYPASYQVKRKAERRGLLAILVEAGAEIQAAACGPCFGVVGSTLRDGEVCISSSNRNFRGRMGSPNSSVYLASPATVAASCIEGRIADARKYL